MEQNLSEKQYTRMTETPIPRLVTSMAVPTVISMLITVAYNTADTYFVSQINKSASAAVGAVYAAMAIIQAIGYGLGMGAGSLISRMLGKKDTDAANKYASSAVFAGLVIGGLITALGLVFCEPFMKLLGCSKTMLPYAVPYANWIFIAAPINCSIFILNNVLRAAGQATRSMICIGISAVINIAIDPLFIFTLKMETAGAALATVLSQSVTLILYIIFFVKKKTVVRIGIKSISGTIKDYGLIIATGLPTIFRQGMGSLAAALLNIQAVNFGDEAVSAVTIANKTYTFVRAVVVGFGQGFQPVVGYNFSAGKKARAWKAYVFTNIWGTVICVLSAALIAIFAKPIMAWFSNDADVIKIGIEVIYFCAAVMPLMAVSTYVNQLYQCVGIKAKATLLASLRQGIFFVPAILIMPIFWGCRGVEAAQPTADLLTFIVCVPFLIYFYRKYIKE